MRALCEHLKITSCLGSLALIVLFVQPAAAEIVYDPWTAADIMQDVSQAMEQVSLLQEQFKALSQGNFNWANLGPLINQMANVVGQFNGLTVQAENFNQQFQQQFPGYTPPQNYNGQYQQMNQTVLGTIQGVLNSVGSSATQIGNLSNMTQSIENTLQYSQNPFQSIQAAAEIGSITSQELGVLQQTLANQTQAQDAYYASQMQNQASSQAAFNNQLSQNNTDNVIYGSTGSNVNLPGSWQ